MDIPHAESLHNWVYAKFVQCSSCTHLRRFFNKMQAKAPPTLLQRLLNKRTGQPKSELIRSQFTLPQRLSNSSKTGSLPAPLSRFSHASLTKTDASLTLLSFRCMEKTPPSDASAMFLRRGDVSVPAQRKLQEMRCTERETLHADRSC